MIYFLSPCSVNNLTKSQVDAQRILLAFLSSSQCNVTVYVMSSSLVLSNFSAFGFASGVTSKMGGT